MALESLAQSALLQRDVLQKLSLLATAIHSNATVEWDESRGEMVMYLPTQGTNETVLEETLQDLREVIGMANAPTDIRFTEDRPEREGFVQYVITQVDEALFFRTIREVEDSTAVHPMTHDPDDIPPVVVMTRPVEVTDRALLDLLQVENYIEGRFVRSQREVAVEVEAVDGEKEIRQVMVPDWEFKEETPPYFALRLTIPTRTTARELEELVRDLNAAAQRPLFELIAPPYRGDRPGVGRQELRLVGLPDHNVDFELHVADMREALRKFAAALDANAGDMAYMDRVGRQEGEDTRFGQQLDIIALAVEADMQEAAREAAQFGGSDIDPDEPLSNAAGAIEGAVNWTSYRQLQRVREQLRDAPLADMAGIIRTAMEGVISRDGRVENYMAEAAILEAYRQHNIALRAGSEIVDPVHFLVEYAEQGGPLPRDPQDSWTDYFVHNGNVILDTYGDRRAETAKAYEYLRGEQGLSTTLIKSMQAVERQVAQGAAREV